jgi:hypothetical protein
LYRSRLFSPSPPGRLAAGINRAGPARRVGVSSHNVCRKRALGTPLGSARAGPNRYPALPTHATQVSAWRDSVGCQWDVTLGRLSVKPHLRAEDRIHLHQLGASRHDARRAHHQMAATQTIHAGGPGNLRRRCMRHGLYFADQRTALCQGTNTPRRTEGNAKSRQNVPVRYRTIWCRWRLQHLRTDARTIASCPDCPDCTASSAG